MSIDELIEIAKSIETEIKEVEDVEEFMDRVLSLSRHQHLGSRGWETDYYELMLTMGGPNVWLRTDGVIVVAWASQKIEYRIEDKDVLEKLKEIHDYLESMQ